MRKRKHLIFERVEIRDIGAEGRAIARIDNIVTFVRLVVPGDIVDLEVIKKRSRYMEARVLRFHKLSESRVEPECRHFGVCGGCKWQHLNYQDQLKYKQKQVADALIRIGKLEIPDISPIKGSKSQYFYRNKLEFAFSGKRWHSKEEIASGIQFEETGGLGFHIPGQYEKVVNIEECLLQPEPSNSIRNEVRKYALEHQLSFFNPKLQEGFLRNLIIRSTSTSEIMVILSFFHDYEKKRNSLLEYLKNKFPSINSLMYSINSKGNDTLYDQEIKTYHGKDFIMEKLEDLHFMIGPKSFFQTNTDQSVELYRIVRNFAGLTGRETVYDLYTGTGTIANFIAGNANKVVGIESVAEATEDARKNSEINGIRNTVFITGDMKEILNPGLFEKHGYPDIMITDPPRSGMHPKVIEAMKEARPEKIVYVSCNPATQARDLALLSSEYSIISVQPVDMFPQTHHVENVVLLERK